MSQLALALEAGVSTRHLSYVETGKAQPSRDLVVRLADALEMPLRERNALLMAAGYAPKYAETELETPAMAQIRRAIELILEQQEPYPAFLLDRHWEVLTTNRAAARIDGFLLPGRTDGHRNMLRRFFDPSDLRPAVVNWEEVAGDLLRHLHDEVAAAPTDAMARTLLDEVLAYPDVPTRWRTREVDAPPPPLLTVVFRRDDRELRFFSTITTFGTPRDVTVDELRIECAFPADDTTAEICRALARDKTEAGREGLRLPASIASEEEFLMGSLLDLLSGGLDESALESLGAQVGATPEQTGRAAHVALPLLLGALQRNAASRDGASALAGALERDHDGSVLDDVAGFFGQPATASDERSLDHIFGARRAPVESVVSRASGLGGAQVIQLLAQLAPLVLAALGRARSARGAGGVGAGGGLGDLLGGVLGTVLGSRPELGGLLGGVLDRDRDDDDRDPVQLDDLLEQVLGGGSGRGSGGGLGGLLGGLLGGPR